MNEQATPHPWGVPIDPQRMARWWWDQLINQAPSASRSIGCIPPRTLMLSEKALRRAIEEEYADDVDRLQAPSFATKVIRRLLLPFPRSSE